MDSMCVMKWRRCGWLARARGRQPHKGGVEGREPHLSPSHFQVADVLPDAPKHTQARPPSNPQEPDMSDSSVKVCVRLRPFNEREMKNDTLPVVTASTDKAEVTLIRGTANRQQRQTYSFDSVYSTFSTQRDVFETISPLVLDVLKGFEATVRARLAPPTPRRSSSCVLSSRARLGCFSARRHTLAERVACAHAWRVRACCSALQHCACPCTNSLRASHTPRVSHSRIRRSLGSARRSLPTARRAPGRRTRWRATSRARSKRA